MNMPKVLAAALLAFATPALASTFALSGWSAPAGQPETLTIVRTSGNGAQCVGLKTGAVGDSAKAGTDYTGVSMVDCFTRYQTRASVQVATHVNQAKLGQTLHFTGLLTVNSTVVSSAGVAIVEPPATIACPDGQQIPAGSSCPPPPPPTTITCPDGSTIPAGQTCPVAPPPPPPPPAPGTALALQSCPALNRPESIVAGRSYAVDEFGHDAVGTEFVALSDATHLGDGYFALYVPVVCVEIAP